MLIDDIRRLYEELRKEKRAQFDRDLPFEELLFDRWERAKSLGFGGGSSIYHSAYVFGDVKVGKMTWIGMFVILDGGGGLEIGDYCSISAGVQIYTHDSVRWAVSGSKHEYEQAAVKIGDCCHVGAQSVIAKGVTIGEHSIVAACSFVRNNVPPNTIVSGNPARAIGRVLVDGKEVRYAIKDSL